MLVIHGFTGTPYEVQYLGERIASSGPTVHTMLLPGHGTSPEDLARTTWQDWADGVERAFDALRARCSRVAVVGQSLGGLLALHLASKRAEVACVASLAAPLWLEGIAKRVATWTAPGGPLSRIQYLPKLGSDVLDKITRRENPGYKRIPTAALAQLMEFMGVVDRALPAVKKPLLVLHGKRDHTAPVASAWRIAEQTHARVVILPRSFHLIAADVERDRVADLVSDFVKEHAACAT